jgi:aerobic carbon-monoxide dehydrogenase large subunit
VPGSLLGNVVPRIEDPALLRGRGTYVDNRHAPGGVYLAFVRSPYAHAEITRVDAT